LPVVFDDLVRFETRLYNALGDRLRAAHGIVTSQYEVLAYLAAHPGGRVADLAAAFAIGIGATSRGVDRLEARGWVKRHPHPADRRSSLLTLTPAGQELAAAAGRTVEEALAELLGGAVDDAALAGLARTLATLRGSLERDRIGLPTG
jgi:MarR family multiple antibiotic resistance transcriptional regulator